MMLSYAVKGSNSCNYPIRLAYTPCHFGGQRTWFSCPRCHAKSTRLYLRDYRFACRQCHRLSYQSQSLDTMGRNQWAYQRLQNKLGEHELKPKGMHWKTYNRLINELMERDYQINQAFNIMAMRFTKRYGMHGL